MPIYIECTVGTTTYTGKECCGSVFSATPILTRYGTCFTTKNAPLQNKVSLAGEGSGLTVVTMHDSTNPLDRKFARYVLLFLDFEKCHTRGNNNFSLKTP